MKTTGIVDLLVAKCDELTHESNRLTACNFANNRYIVEKNKEMERFLLKIATELLKMP